jgi:hypothetical protein
MHARMKVRETALASFCVSLESIPGAPSSLLPVEFLPAEFFPRVLWSPKRHRVAVFYRACRVGLSVSSSVRVH